MPPGRAPAHRHEGGVAAVLRDMRLDPGHGHLGVDDLRRPGRSGTEPVVDGDAHPTPGHQFVEHRLALLALLPHHPRPAVDVHHDRRAGRRRQTRPVDVESVATLAIAPVVDVLCGQHRSTLERNGSGHPPEATPGGSHRLGGNRETPRCAPRRGRRPPRGPPAGRRGPVRPGRPSCRRRWPVRAIRPSPGRRRTDRRPRWRPPATRCSGSPAHPPANRRRNWGRSMALGGRGDR